MKHPIFDIETDYFTKNLNKALQMALDDAAKFRSEFITPEHLLYAISYQTEFFSYCEINDIDIDAMHNELFGYIINIDSVPADEDYTPMVSANLHELVQGAECVAILKAKEEGINPDECEEITFFSGVTDVMHLMNEQNDSMAQYILKKYVTCNEKWYDNLLNFYIPLPDKQYSVEAQNPMVTAEAFINGKRVDLSGNAMYQKLMAHANRLLGSLQSLEMPKQQSANAQQQQQPEKEGWEQNLTCISEIYSQKKPLIGRQKEMEHAIRVLCRKDKNNPIFIGEPGVGKTAIIYGLAKMIDEGNVPDCIAGKVIYALDMASLVAGASYHGEFERRVKEILDGAKAKGNIILYIDEIHTVCETGGGNSSMNAAEMLKPYLEDGNIQFIGTTTYQDYNKSIVKNKAVARRFAKIDIKEPSVDETVEIISSLLPVYEKHHGVKYDMEAIKYAVEQSDSRIVDRFLPDKAIDIIDEAGAFLQQNPILNKNGEPKAARYQKVSKDIVKKILIDVCRIDANALASENNDSLKDLDKRISKLIYGQDEAIKNVVRSVMMSKAGLMEPDKPIASLLFVGPTGVGKTEVCKVLAQELGVELIRFDMSEYTEKHTISKLIGSPAGYVGYEEGGLLTDAIRKTPNCVLLLDEIEKAHSDIYNILLQVMDYARLTDNKGNKADFRNVILIMTSNAGAQYAGQAGIGFAGGQTKGQAMLQTVKKTFKPEFLNRLSGTVVFNEMDKTMASLILDKKLKQLSERLAAKNASMVLTPEAREFLLIKGFTQQYGAREMDRAIQQYLTPLLMEQLLFGKLKKGGEVKVGVSEEKLVC
ncbi:MAG: AAA family ATPase [Prevotellaceae bacterium]|nr:AAA family ATPase [Prevotellaceae bacterium]